MPNTWFYVWYFNTQKHIIIYTLSSKPNTRSIKKSQLQITYTNPIALFCILGLKIQVGNKCTWFHYLG